MKVDISKEKLFNLLSEASQTLIVDNNERELIKEKLLKSNNIAGNIIEHIFNDVNYLDKIDARITILYTKTIHNRSTGTITAKLNPENWFTEMEIKEADQYRYWEEKDDIREFPLVLDKVLMDAEGRYTLNVSMREIALWGINGLTYWNPDIQREGIRQVRHGKTIVKPKIYHKNVKEIVKSILDGKQEKTSLVFNVPFGITGLENDLYYDEKKMQLIINEGARLDIVDGMHRTLGAKNAYIQDKENENLDRLSFTVEIFNFSTERTQQYQAQLAKATPLQKSRIKELEKARKADLVVKNLKNDTDSDLKDKISSGDIPNRKIGELVSFGTLSDSIDIAFGDILKKQFDVLEITKYLKEFYTYMFGYFEDQVNDKNCLLFINKIFFGHILLARDMRDNNISFDKLPKLINLEDFNKDNPNKNIELFMQGQKVNKYKQKNLMLEVFTIKDKLKE